ncbi:hypothetical protein [Rhodanobacter sp. 7MK24]|nr:hypothetical protein [Rhodanobacter sp. 7MK24]
MNTFAAARHAMNRHAPVMLALLSSLSIAFGFLWSLHAAIHTLA